MVLTIGVDVGGTKVAAGVVDEHGRIIEKLKRTTPAASPARTAEVIGDVVAELRGRHRAEAVGIGAAGFVDGTRSTVLFAPNLAWRDEPVQQQIEDRVGLPVVVENDANAAAWAEFTLGAARGHQDVVLITVGTGIGGGIIINGELAAHKIAHLNAFIRSPKASLSPLFLAKAKWGAGAPHLRRFCLRFRTSP